MKTLKKILQANRGLASTMLLFLFLYAGLVRNSVLVFASTSQNEITVSKAVSKNGTVVYQLDDEDSQNPLTQFKKADNDVDDAEIANDFSFSLKNFFNYFEKQTIFRFDPFKSIQKLPLYDLFCNWKFHLLG